MKFDDLAVQILTSETGEGGMPAWGGSGFLLGTDGKTWLVSAAHNFESRLSGFSGYPDRRYLTLLRPGVPAAYRWIDTVDGRAVRYVSLEGERLDFIAIALTESETPGDVHIFRRDEPLELPPLPHQHPKQITVTLSSGGIFPGGTGDPALVIGYPNGLWSEATAHQVLCGDLRSLSTRSFAFSPGAPEGCSGGPVIDASLPAAGKLLGVYTHSGTNTGPLEIEHRQFTMKINVGHATHFNVAVAACVRWEEGGLETISVAGAWHSRPEVDPPR